MRGSSPILITAALSLAVLVAAFGVRLGNATGKHATVIDPASLEPAKIPTYIAVEDADGNGTPDWQDALMKNGMIAVAATSSARSTDAQASDPLSSLAENVAQALYGGYVSLKHYDAYTPQKARELGMNVAQQIRAPQLFVPHTVQEIVIDDDMSVNRVLKYRADLRVALAPMVTDDEPEFEMFARYIDSKDTSWLLKLSNAAARYHEAEKNMLAVSVPKDAVPEHLRALNSLGKYAEIIDRMSHAQSDALATVAILKTYNEDEQEMLNAFNALAQYYVRTIAQK